MEESLSSEVYETPIDWPLLTYISTGITLGCLVLSVLLNLSSLCAIWGNQRLRKYGYFHLLILFCEVHMAYFVVKSLLSVHLSLEKLGALSQNWIKTWTPVIRLLPDVTTCLLGTSLLLLIAMTLDCTFSNSIRSKPIIKCLRTFLPFVALIIGIMVFLIVLVAKFNMLFDSVFKFSAVFTIILVHGLYMVVFVLFPAVFIVIFGTINWVSDLNSNRFLKEPRRRSRKLDHQICVLSIPVILLFLVATIIRFSHDLQIYQSEELSEITQLVLYSVLLALDVSFVFYPLLFMCQLGGYCCCLEKPN
ncbi:hypothetical protein TCAL_17170 [Tigriopus californicus]|uniref:G-protein coupled receptors family 1 profile domain-containing protein n=1 Tax=Tigriopus californicus TaxID=6832 RepID=A0A553N995_TIGCA|nr:hypothetical protein TCAL_17170 [Tigriopus californicus]